MMESSLHVRYIVFTLIVLEFCKHACVVGKVLIAVHEY